MNNDKKNRVKIEKTEKLDFMEKIVNFKYNQKVIGDNSIFLNTSEIAFTQAVRSAQMAKP